MGSALCQGKNKLKPKRSENFSKAARHRGINRENREGKMQCPKCGSIRLKRGKENMWCDGCGFFPIPHKTYDLTPAMTPEELESALNGPEGDSKAIARAIESVTMNRYHVEKKDSFGEWCSDSDYGIIALALKRGNALVDLGISAKVTQTITDQVVWEVNL